MNRITFIYKFIFNNKSIKYLKFSSYFPLFGTILGIVIVLLTISIMNGMEYAIFTKLKEVSFPSKILNLPLGNDFDELMLDLKSKNIDFKLGYNGKVIIQNDENQRLVNINGIKGYLKIKGIFLIYIATFLVWVDDNTDGLEKTMNKLNKYIDSADEIFKKIK